MLPMAPALGILVMRRYDRRTSLRQNHSSWGPVYPLLPAACLALAVTWADYSLAHTQRAAARLFQTKSKDYPHRIWFQGHWGFQYYMESFGAKPLDLHDPELEPGDLLVVPLNNSNVKKLNRDDLHLVVKREFIPCRWLGTIQLHMGAGFYSDRWGPLPFVFAPMRSEDYLLFLVETFKNPSEAVAYFQRALRMKSRYGDAYNLMKKTLAASEEIDETITTIQKDLKLKPDNPGLHFQLGTLYERQGELNKAIAQYRRGLILEPDFAQLHNKLGDVLARVGKIDEALSHYQSAIELEPDYAEANLKIASDELNTR